MSIQSIPSRSPKARGRIERLFGTFQDRLVSELRLAGAKGLEEANRVLKEFLPRYNHRFAVPPSQSGSAYCPVKKGEDLDEVFCFKYRRVVGADNVVPFGGQRIQIQPSNGRQSYHRARVEIQKRMDGSLAVYYQGKCLATKPAPPEASVLRVQKMGQKTTKAPLAKLNPSASEGQKTSPPKKNQPYKPGPDHPWRKPWKRKLYKGDIFTGHHHINFKGNLNFII